MPGHESASVSTRGFDASCKIEPSEVYQGHLYCKSHDRLIDPFASLVNTCLGPKQAQP